MSGWLIGLPLTSGPVAFFLALDQGTRFAAAAGLLTPFPIHAAVLSIFAHRLLGPAAATAVLTGLLFGLFSFVAFFTVMAATLIQAGSAVSFVLAIVAAALIQAATLIALRFRAGRLQIAAGEAPVGQRQDPEEPGDDPADVGQR